MGELGGHLLLLTAVAALVGASLRIGSLAAPSGLERLLAAAPLAAALAVCQALALGLLNIGTEPVALAATAALTWLASQRLTAPEQSVATEGFHWWTRATPVARTAAGALAGALVAWAAWNLYRPDIGIDGLYYHLPEVLAWVHNGQPGSDLLIHPWFYVGSYPVSHEVLLAWAMGISRSLVPQGLLTVAMLPLIGLGGWVALRSLAVAAPARWLAIAAMLTVPFLASQVDGPANEVPAMAWLVCAAGLAAAARDRPALLCPMLVAAGLAVGSKTTALPLTAILLAFVFWRDRDRLRPLTWPLAAAALVAAVVGATWYLRTLIEHGSPFWPFAATPFGDPVPPFLDTFHSLLSAPRETTEGRVGDYVTVMSGAWLTIGAAVFAPLWAPRREVIAGAVLVAGSVLLWSSAPTTGLSDFSELSAPVSQTRYLFPTIALAALTLAVSATGGGARAKIGLAALTIAVVWNVGQITTGEFPGAFSSAWVVAGALAGAALTTAAGLLPLTRVTRSATARTALAGVVLVAVAAGLALASSGYTARYADHTENFDGPLVRLFENGDIADDDRPVSMTPLAFGMLTGDGLDRRVALIPLGEPCAAVKARRERGWVILRDNPLFRDHLGYTAGDCLRDVPPSATVGRYRIYAPI